VIKRPAEFSGSFYHSSIRVSPIKLSNANLIVGAGCTRDWRRIMMSVAVIDTCSQPNNYPGNNFGSTPGAYRSTISDVIGGSIGRIFLRE